MRPHPTHLFHHGKELKGQAISTRNRRKNNEEEGRDVHLSKRGRAALVTKLVRESKEKLSKRSEDAGEVH